MSILRPLYLRMTRKRFERPFSPLGAASKHKFLVSAPGDAAGFIRALPFISGLAKADTVVLLMPRALEHLLSTVRLKKCEVVFYEKRPAVLGAEYRLLQDQLGEREFDVLIELDTPPNISLPHLCNAERRVAFFDPGVFPYYNVLIKDGYASLRQFFGLGEQDAREIFHFQSRELRTLEKKLGKTRPLLFVNERDATGWEGGCIVLGTDVAAADPAAWKMLYIADAYRGAHDAFYEFAVLTGKRILDG